MTHTPQTNSSIRRSLFQRNPKKEGILSVCNQQFLSSRSLHSFNLFLFSFIAFPSSLPFCPPFSSSSHEAPRYYAPIGGEKRKWWRNCYYPKRILASSWEIKASTIIALECFSWKMLQVIALNSTTQALMAFAVTIHMMVRQTLWLLCCEEVKTQKKMLC